MFIRSLVLLGWLISATAAAQTADAAVGGAPRSQPPRHTAVRAQTPSVTSDDEHGPVPNEAPGGPVTPANATNPAPSAATPESPAAAAPVTPAVPNAPGPGGTAVAPDTAATASGASDAGAPNQPLDTHVARGSSLTADRLFFPAVIVGGAGAAALLASLVTGLGAHGMYTKLERDCKNDLCPSSAQNRIDGGKTMATVSTILTGVGIAAVGVSAALLIMAANRRTDTQSATARVQLSAGPTPLGIGATAAF